MEPTTTEKQDAELEEIEQLAELANQFLMRASAFQKHAHTLRLPINRSVGMAFTNVQQGQLWLGQAAAELCLHREKQASEGSQVWHVETPEEREQKIREIVNQPGGYGKTSQAQPEGE